MKKQLLYSILVLIAIFTLGCEDQSARYLQKKTIAWEDGKQVYIDGIEECILFLQKIETQHATLSSNKNLFLKARRAFKIAEPFASYLNPEVGHRLNGPALPIFKEDNGRVLPAVGLQKLEESMYEGASPADFEEAMETTLGLLQLLRADMIQKELTPKRFFIATHQQLLRILSFSLTEFDTPLSHQGTQDAVISLQNLFNLYTITLQKEISTSTPDLDTQFTEAVNAAVSYLQLHQEDLDKYVFIRSYFNPITKNWVAIREQSNVWDDTYNGVINLKAPTFFESDSFNADFFIPATNRTATPAQIALGESLFFEEKLSKNGELSCATCHQPKKAYTDGLRTSIQSSKDGNQRNSPTLINTIFQQNFFWDGRSETVIDQIASVFLNEEEFNSSVHVFSDAILQDTTYARRFQNAYGVIPKKNTEIIKAISSYVATLNSFDSKFDRNMRGQENTFTNEERLGFNLFMGKALCATCHFIPLTNGTVPPFYTETEREVIGVPETNANQKLDGDFGYYWKFQNPLHKGMFKTPTLRNVALTAPYMHNGVYNTLEEVISFYNQGGGGGLGFEVEHQTLPFDNLSLSDQEIAGLIAFLHTLTDTSLVEIPL